MNPNQVRRSHSRRSWASLWVLGLLPMVLLYPAVLRAQDGGSSTPAPGGESSSREEANPVAAAPAPAVVNLETGQRLTSPISPLRLKNLSVLSFETVYLFDNNFLFSQDNPQSAQAATLRALVVYSIRRRTAELTLQYRPYLLSSRGTFEKDFTSHTLDLRTEKHLGPRWLLTIGDSFRLAPDRGRLFDFGVIPDYLNGTVTKNPFLATGQKYLENDLRGSAEHFLSVRNRVGFDLGYQLIRVSGIPDAEAGTTDPFLRGLQSMQSLSAGVSWTHVFDPSRDVQVRYGHERRYYNSGGNVQFHNLLFTYNWRVRPSLRLRLTAGPSILLPARPTGAIAASVATKSYQATFAATKTFRASGITFTFARNADFTGVISNSFNDRYDVSYTRRLRQRWNVIVGAGYVRQDFLIGPPVEGQQTWFRTDYLLSRSWSAYTSFSSLHETGVTRLGRRNLLMAGIRWSWRPASESDSGDSF